MTIQISKLSLLSFNTLVVAGLALAPNAWAASNILGSINSYGIMGDTVTINSTTGGTTTINGDLGTTSGSVAGEGAYTFTNGELVTTTPQNGTDFNRAYNGLAGMDATSDLSGKILGTAVGAITLTPGVYNFVGTAQLTGELFLDAEGQSNAVWVFNIGSTFTTAANSKVTFINQAANSVVNDGLFWRVATTTTIGARTSFAGNLLGQGTISLGDVATISQGRVLGNIINLDDNEIDFVAADSGYSGGLAFVGPGDEIAAVPEPAATVFVVSGLMMLFVLAKRSRAVRG